MTDAVEDARLGMVRARNDRGAQREPLVEAAQGAQADLAAAAKSFAAAMDALGGQTAPMMGRVIVDSVGHASSVLDNEAAAAAADIAAR